MARNKMLQFEVFDLTIRSNNFVDDFLLSDDFPCHYFAWSDIFNCSRIFSELSVNQEERLTHKITPTPNSAAKAKIIAI